MKSQASSSGSSTPGATGGFGLARVYPIVDLSSFESDCSYLKQLTENGVRIVQIRAKSLDTKNLVRAARRLMAAVPALMTEALLIINDDVQAALELGAGGVHLGQDDLSPLEARRMLGQDAVIGMSTHTIQQVRAAQNLPVDYLGFGPVFISPTKQGHAEVTGVSKLAQAAADSRLPIVAIGGVTAENAKQVYAAGAAAAAVISDLRNAADLAGRLRQFRSALD